MFNIISKAKYAYIFSGVLTVLCILSLAVWGLKYDIDFTGGTRMVVKFANEIPSKEAVGETLKDLNLSGLTFQGLENNSMVVRYASGDDSTNDKTNIDVWQAISGKYEGSTQSSVDFFNSSVSGELKSKSITALVLAIMAIMAYIAWAFRKVSRPVESWKYGAGAVVALAHDILITAGVFSVLGHFYGIEIGIPFIAALLTILGFSVHDTIVVYDRTRENLLRSSQKVPFPEVVNRSLNETLVRSINTSLTVVITLLAIYLFGGESIKNFSLALLVGIIFGTYSSVFIATSLLVTSYELGIKYKN